MSASEFDYYEMLQVSDNAVGGDTGVVHQHLAPPGCEVARVRPPEPAAAAGHDRHLAVEAQLAHGWCSPRDSNSV